MCGIAGFFYKNGESNIPLGRRLTSMASVLGSRGLDGTGMALYGELPDGHLVLRIHLESNRFNEQAEIDLAISEITSRLEKLVAINNIEYTGNILRVELKEIEHNNDIELMAKITSAIEDSGTELFSIGNSMEIIKDIGPAVELEDYKVTDFQGSHGLTHTRLATESRVDICYSHPFWARPFPDIAVVHNGQLTNHNKLRRSLQRRGYEFSTTNDSEVIAVFIADQLLNGLSLEESLSQSIEKLDGTFTYLISTSDGIGFAKDRFSTKPLIVAENKSFVAMASEEVALHSMISDDTDLYEPTAKAVQTWLR
ncbi:MAG: hypothetical protein FI698_04685 [SAR202 cluster bacterium]|nr:hypothetical protein [SAR202 cluster bacterium]|tara:strand:- start:142841 stop:143773 length:933 start_codon:yes stop_codon:yes gene_type:complete